MPKLIGMWRLPFARERPRSTMPPGDHGVREMIRDVATDTDGQQWGLVVRLEPIVGMPRCSRVAPVRWVRWDATPFSPDEVVTPNSWDPVEEPPA